MMQNDERAEQVNPDRVIDLCNALVECIRDHKMLDVYAALVYCLGKTISVAREPAQLLGLTIPKLAAAAEIDCIEVNSMEELEEALDDDRDAKSTH